MLRLFHLSVAEETYQGGLAGLSYSIDSSDSGISFGFSGYNQRMGEWIERLVRKFAAFKADAEQLVVVLDEVSAPMQSHSHIPRTARPHPSPPLRGPPAAAKQGRARRLAAGGWR